MPPRLDISNKKFGKLTALKIVGRSGSNNVWECLCECGKITQTTATSLMKGNTRSCGCYRKDLFEINKEIFVGKKYGSILVTMDVGIKNGKRIVVGKCDCGVVKEYRASHLKSGKTISCGCYPEKNRSAMSTKHGLSGNPLYFVWASMMNRCYNENFSDYHNYGGRGIFVCDRWHEVSFFVSDMTEGYCKGLQIDRIDNNKGYSKNNCRWATRKENNRNKRTNRMITANGVTQSLVAWSEETGIKYSTLSGFIQRGGDAGDFFSKIMSDL